MPQRFTGAIVNAQKAKLQLNLSSKTCIQRWMFSVWRSLISILPIFFERQAASTNSLYGFQKSPFEISIPDRFGGCGVKRKAYQALQFIGGLSSGSSVTSNSRSLVASQRAAAPVGKLVSSRATLVWQTVAVVPVLAVATSVARTSADLGASMNAAIATKRA